MALGAEQGGGGVSMRRTARCVTVGRSLVGESLSFISSLVIRGTFFNPRRDGNCSAKRLAELLVAGHFGIHRRESVQCLGNTVAELGPRLRADPEAERYVGFVGISLWQTQKQRGMWGLQGSASDEHEPRCLCSPGPSLERWAGLFAE
ncbi:hypothetical protein ACLOJK_005010 [Asimina triloba]